MIIYQCDSDGNYLFKTNARQSPREKNVYVMPAWSTDKPKPDDEHGFDWKFDFDKKDWIKVEWSADRFPKTEEELRLIEIELNKQKEEHEKISKIKEAETLVAVLLNNTSWMIERHNEQTVLQLETTLGSEHYSDLLKWRQQLRDLSKDTSWPNVVWPSISVPGFTWDSTNVNEVS